MSRRGLLERFRPAAPPGGAGRVGVPQEGTEDTALRAVLAALVPTQEEAARIRTQGRAQAQALREASVTEVAGVLARARVEAAAQRAVEASRAHEAGERESRRMTEEARTEADRLRTEGQRRLPDLLARVLDEVRREGQS